MAYVIPKVFLVGETAVIPEGLQEMLTALGAPLWRTDAATDSEKLVEVAGKLCYMSFDTSLNENLTKTGTRNNHDYIQQGLVGQHHGSVLEHCTVNVVMLDVSRVLTHELVRHRVGIAYSQTSGRYVRKGELDLFVPSDIKNDPELMEIYTNAVRTQEQFLAEMVEASGINDMKTRESFDLKKKLTSAFRRITAGGQATNIMATMNHRTIRHLIETRTHEGAEEEIRIVFAELYRQVKSRYPALYADGEVTMVDDIPKITFVFRKV